MIPDQAVNPTTLFASADDAAQKKKGKKIARTRADQIRRDQENVVPRESCNEKRNSTRWKKQKRGQERGQIVDARKIVPEEIKAGWMNVLSTFFYGS